MQRLEVSGAVRPIYGSLGVKRLIIWKYAAIHLRTRIAWTATQKNMAIAYMIFYWDRDRGNYQALLDFISNSFHLNSANYFKHYSVNKINNNNNNFCYPFKSARRRGLYLTTHNTHKRKTSMPWRDSKPHSQQASGRRPHALDPTATGTGIHTIGCFNTFSEDV